MEALQKNLFWIILGSVLVFNIYLYVTEVSGVQMRYSHAKNQAQNNKKFIEVSLSFGGAQSIPYVKERQQYCKNDRTRVKELNKFDVFFHGAYDKNGRQTSIGINADTGGYHSDEEKDKPFGTFYLDVQNTDKNLSEGIILSDIRTFYKDFAERLAKDAEEARIGFGSEYGLTDHSKIDERIVREKVRNYYIFREIYRVIRNSYTVVTLPHVKLDDKQNIVNIAKKTDYIPSAFGGARIIFRDTESGEVIQGKLARKDEMKEVVDYYKKMSKPVFIGVVPENGIIKSGGKTYKIEDFYFRFPDPKSKKKAIILHSVSFSGRSPRDMKFADEEEAYFASYKVTIEIETYLPLVRQIWLKLIKQEQTVEGLTAQKRKAMFESSGSAKIDPPRRIFFIPVSMKIERSKSYENYPFDVPHGSGWVLGKDPNQIEWTEYFKPDPPVRAKMVLHVIYGKDNIKESVPDIVKQVENGVVKEAVE